MEDQSKNAPPCSPERKRKLLLMDYLVFLAALILLAVVLYLGDEDAQIQRNVIYLVALSLSCGMVFAFLPFDASFEWKGIFRAGGTAAIFALTLSIVMNFTSKDYQRQISESNDQISSLQKVLNGKDAEITALRDASEKATASQATNTAAQNAVKSLISQALDATKALNDDVVQGKTLAYAASTNTSDNRTCVLRGSQSVEALARAQPRIDLVLSNLSSINSLTK